MGKKVLGKGLDALIPHDEIDGNEIKEIRINEIEPSISQPRKNFDEEKIKQLAESIKQHGIVQPIIVKREGNIYRIIAGERRWRAARVAGLATVPALIKEITERQAVEIALIENLQREDLNPIEEGEAYQKLINEFNMTQEEIANIIGKSRPAIANSVRLLCLDENVKDMIKEGKLSSGHGRALVSIEEKEVQRKLAEEIIEKNLNVRETEKRVKKHLEKRNDKYKNIKSAGRNDYEVGEVEEKLKNILGTRVRLIDKNKKGKIIIEYYSYDELERIIEMMESIKH